MANDFKVFAGGVGANALTPAAYAALTTLLSQGFQTGTASSQQVNTVWRQATSVAAAIGQFISNNGGNAVDDGNVTNLTAAFTAALAAAVPAGNLAGAAFISTTSTLTAADSGKLLTVLGSAAAITLTLPNPTTVGAGKTYRVFNNSSFNATMATPAGGFAGPGSSVILPGMQTTLVCDGFNWILLDGAGASLKSNSGYFVLPSGIIVQWGRVSGNGTKTFPIQFPSTCHIVVCASAAVAGVSSVCHSNGFPASNTSFPYVSENVSYPDGMFIAIGS